MVSQTLLAGLRNYYGEVAFAEALAVSATTHLGILKGNCQGGQEAGPDRVGAAVRGRGDVG